MVLWYLFLVRPGTWDFVVFDECVFYGERINIYMAEQK
jgi:hypothetical protein